MIVSASYRTDIPAFYARWFMRRLAAGRCLVASPYGGGEYEVLLTPKTVDGFVFWTRNIRPLLPVAARESGNRAGCRCARSRDIGAYDTCPHGCVYCYAVADRDRAVANYRGHDPEAETLRR